MSIFKKKPYRNISKSEVTQEYSCTIRFLDDSEPIQVKFTVSRPATWLYLCVSTDYTVTQGGCLLYIITTGLKLYRCRHIHVPPATSCVYQTTHLTLLFDICSYGHGDYNTNLEADERNRIE